MADACAALAQTSRLKEANGRIASDAVEAIQWLDDATSNFPSLVTLQGGYEKFDTWAHVERFALPKTLFSEGDSFDDSAITDDLSQQFDSKLSTREARYERASFSSVESYLSPSTPPSAGSIRTTSPLSPPTSPPKAANARSSPQPVLRPENREEAEITTGGRATYYSETPVGLQPLFNYILWRIHQELDPLAALETFIFLSDDLAKRKHAQRFGIRTKSLAEIRYAIAREGREARNRQLVQKKEAATKSSTTTMDNSSMKTPLTTAAIDSLDGTVHTPSAVHDVIHQDNSDDEEILLKRSPKVPAAMLAPKSPRMHNKVLDPNQFSRSPVVPPRSGMRSTSRGGAARGAMRGNAGGKGSSRDNGSGPIDPDSFARPATNIARFRGGRKLWMPT